MTDWLQHAACRGAPLAVFYPPEGRGPKPANQYRAARGYCSQCPVIRQCEADALVTDRVFGAHGFRAGMSPDERARLVRR